MRPARSAPWPALRNSNAAPPRRHADAPGHARQATSTSESTAAPPRAAECRETVAELTGQHCGIHPLRRVALWISSPLRRCAEQEHSAALSRNCHAFAAAQLPVTFTAESPAAPWQCWGTMERTQFGTPRLQEALAAPPRQHGSQRIVAAELVQNSGPTVTCPTSGTLWVPNTAEPIRTPLRLGLVCLLDE